VRKFAQLSKLVSKYRLLSNKTHMYIYSYNVMSHILINFLQFYISGKGSSAGEKLLRKLNSKSNRHFIFNMYKMHKIIKYHVY